MSEHITVRSRTEVPTSARESMSRHALKAYISVLGAASPRAAGRKATDVFGYTRGFRKEAPKDVVPLGARRFSIEGINGVEHGYLWGEGPKTALLVHGWGADGSSMYAFVKRLREAGYRVAVFDAPAHGISAGTLTTMSAFRNTVVAAAMSLGRTDLVVAHSLGAIATFGAIRELEVAVRPTAIALLAPACSLPEVITNWSARFLSLKPPVLNAMYEELHRRNGVPVSYWDITALGHAIEGLSVKVFHGEADAIVPICESEKITTVLPYVELSRVSNTGHFRILASQRVIDGVIEFAQYINRNTNGA